MTYEEFEREIKKLGLVCDYSYFFVSVYHSTHNSYQLAYMSLEMANRMTTTSEISRLPENVGKKVLTLCYKLARTPLVERGTVVLD